MRFSMQIFGLPPDHLGPIVQLAEEVGFTTIWLSDHTVTPVEYGHHYPYNASGNPGYALETPLVDIAVMLGALASLTSRIELAAGVLVLPLRNPFHLANAWGTLQNIAGGRAVLGIGAGWMEEEFDAIGVPFHNRGARLEEMLDVLDLLWSGETVEYQGDYYSFPPLRLGAQPISRIPRIFGGHGERSLQRAAQRGDGWFGPNVELADTVAYKRSIDEFRAEIGREDPFMFYARLHGELGLELVEEYTEAGFENLVVSPFVDLSTGVSLDSRLQTLEEISRTVGLI